MDNVYLAGYSRRTSPRPTRLSRHTLCSHLMLIDADAIRTLSPLSTVPTPPRVSKTLLSSKVQVQLMANLRSCAGESVRYVQQAIMYGYTLNTWLILSTKTLSRQSTCLPRRICIEQSLFISFLPSTTNMPRRDRIGRRSSTSSLLSSTDTHLGVPLLDTDIHLLYSLDSQYACLDVSDRV